MKIIGLAGYTCSGKSTALEYFISLGWHKVDIGEVIRETHHKYFTEVNIMDFTLRTHEIYGNNWSVLKGLGQIHPNTENIVVAGIRFMDQINLLRKYSNKLILIHLKSGVDQRTTRFLTRNRTDTLSLQMNLNEKDEFERKHFEIEEVIKQCHIVINNDSTIMDLNKNLDIVIDSSF